MPGTPIRKLFLPLIALCVTIVLGGFALAQTNTSVSPKLTPRLQELLRKEMNSINDASQKILGSLVAGDDARVAILAQQIHDSFIMRQSMTPEDKAHLMKVAPKNFVQMDKGFHAIAAELANAAKAADKPLQRKHFGRMIEACSACHALYAANRFPGFTQ